VEYFPLQNEKLYLRTKRKTKRGSKAYTFYVEWFVVSVDKLSKRSPYLWGVLRCLV